MGNRYQPETVRCVHNGTDVMIYSYGDIFFGNQATSPDPTSDFILLGNSRLVTRANRFRVDFQQPARFGGQAGTIPTALQDIALAVSPLAPDQVQLALCGPEGNLLFQVRVNSDYMDFENPLTSPSPTT